MVGLGWMDFMGEAGTDEDSTPLDVVLIPGQCSGIYVFDYCTVSDPPGS